MLGRRAVPWGRQAEPFGGAVAWVLPNPSGRNLAFNQDALVAAYRALRLSVEEGKVVDAAGIEPATPSV
jgi:TDG/mug DNA glycosylase family protein